MKPLSHNLNESVVHLVYGRYRQLYMGNVHDIAYRSTWEKNLEAILMENAWVEMIRNLLGMMKEKGVVKDHEIQKIC